MRRVHGMLFSTILATASLQAQVFSTPQTPAQPAPASTPIQTVPAPPQSSATAASTAASKKTAQRGRTTQTTQAAPVATRTIPIETAPPTQPAQVTAAQQAQQRQADERLLERQEARSDKAAATTDRQVNKAQQRQDDVQNQQRVLDLTPPVAPTAYPQPLPAQSIDPSQLPVPGQTSPTPTTPGQPAPQE